MEEKLTEYPYVIAYHETLDQWLVALSPLGIDVKLYGLPQWLRTTSTTLYEPGDQFFG